jgi:hypothetical protein
MLNENFVGSQRPAGFVRKEGDLPFFVGKEHESVVAETSRDVCREANAVSHGVGGQGKFVGLGLDLDRGAWPKEFSRLGMKALAAVQFSSFGICPHPRRDGSGRGGVPYFQGGIVKSAQRNLMFLM